MQADIYTGLVKFNNGLALVSSKEIADNFSKVHRDVVRSIKELHCSDEFRERNFAQSFYMSPQNKKLSCFDMTRDGFAFLCMGFTGKTAAIWKERYINAFNEMESYIRNDIASMGLIKSINAASLRIDEIKAAGSQWGKNGVEIRKRKSEAVHSLCKLLDHAQLQLGFELV